MMSLHQIIYTSCMRGINGVNDGQQVFSYDASFKDANSDEVKSLFSYQPPALEPGVIMTEEIALTLPKSFTYRMLENGANALALNTYLGRDYMGSAGRFGNHLSHVVLADENEMQNYPCEFYGSSLLREHMEFEEVNNPNRPDYLPVPVLERGFAVDIDTIIDFLSVDDRMEIFKDMLYATLAFEKERKRVVICDEPENIVMWIAAIEYTLPLKTALGINFSTYDFDPSLSASQICGVIPKGSRYTIESQRLHFVFDFYSNVFAKFEKDEHYFDFIDTSMSFSYDSLQDFHHFIEEGYNYNKADEKIYSAYRLYSLLSDGLEGLTEPEIKEALKFAEEFASDDEEIRILTNLLEQKDCLLKIDINSFLCVMHYVLSKYSKISEEYRNSIKCLIIDRVLCEFLNDNHGESDFVAFYNEIDSVCRTREFSVATELMGKSNREKLFTVMQTDVTTWKIAFIIKVISTFVKDQKVSINELNNDAPLGQTYYGIVHSVYSKNSQNGFFLVTRILDEFVNNSSYLVNMALNIEGMLLDLQNGNREVNSMWKYFCQNMVKYHRSDFNTAYSVFEKYGRTELVYMLYMFAISVASNATEYQQIFKEHYNNFLLKNHDYAVKYGENILNDYYGRLENCELHSSYSARLDLFGIISSKKMNVPFAEALVNSLISIVQFESPSKENSNLIQKSFEYLYNNLHIQVNGRLLLLVIGLVFERCKTINQLRAAFDNLEHLTINNKADLSKINEDVAKNYFEWLLPEICELCERKADMERFYNLFEMSSNNTLFFVNCAQIYLKQSKSDKDFSIFCEFLGLVFEKGNIGVHEEVGKILCKLSKQKLSDLDDAVKDNYRKEYSYLKYWDNIKDIAESTNPILNNISNLFKRKNK